MNTRRSACSTFALVLAAGMPASLAVGQIADSYSKTVKWECKKPADSAHGAKTVIGPVSASASHKGAIQPQILPCSRSFPEKKHSYDWNPVTGKRADGSTTIPTLDSGEQNCDPVKARATMGGTIGKWTEIPNDPDNKGNIETSISGTATAKAGAAPPNVQEAKARASGYVWINGATGVITSEGERKGKATNGSTINLKRSPQAPSNQATKWTDPIWIELYEWGTTLVARETLMTLDATRVGAADVSLDASGIVLRADADGYSRAEFRVAYPSPWLTMWASPLQATLEGGHLALSPEAAALPWQLTYHNGKVVEARLAGGVAMACEYRIPEFLTVPGVEYQTRLNYDAALDRVDAADGGDGLGGIALWNNGGVETDPSAPCLPPGVAASVASGPMLGVSVEQQWGDRVADDFLVADASGWDVNEVELVAYVPGLPTPPGFSPISAVNVQVWSGKPGEPGSYVVWGDPWTNRMISAESLPSSTGGSVNRVAAEPLPCQSDMPLFRVRASMPTHLPPGAYWLDWQMTTWMGGGVVAPPVTIAGMAGHPAGNARQTSGWTGQYGPIVDVTQAGRMAPQEMPFVIRGQRVAPPSTPCYANCDGSAITPILNVNDFACFLNAFGAASVLPPAEQVGHYANCDGSTAFPILNVNDFACFLNAYAAGCTTP
ncbi:MAG: hypothetical protein JNM80_06495 [Phycisphaerae bacterium]|nr:hypothetical protein [Phycisphaerae bacterium]